MTHVINQGMSMYWGTSRWSAMEIMVSKLPFETLECDGMYFLLYGTKLLKNENHFGVNNRLGFKPHLKLQLKTLNQHSF